MLHPMQGGEQSLQLANFQGYKGFKDFVQDYTFKNYIGAGGCGVASRCMRRDDGCPVVLKTIQAGVWHSGRFTPVVRIRPCADFLL